MRNMDNLTLTNLLRYLRGFRQINGVVGKVSTCTIIFTLMGTSLYAQINKRDVQQKQTYQLSMDQSSRYFRKGEHYQFKVTLTNDTKQEMFFVYGHNMADFMVDVRDQKDHSVSLSKEAQDRKLVPRTGSYQTIRLNPGENYNFDLDLGYFYSLGVGKYKLNISMPVYGKDKVAVHRPAKTCRNYDQVMITGAATRTAVITDETRKEIDVRSIAAID